MGGRRFSPRKSPPRWRGAPGFTAADRPRRRTAAHRHGHAPRRWLASRREPPHPVPGLRGTTPPPALALSRRSRQHPVDGRLRPTPRRPDRATHMGGTPPADLDRRCPRHARRDAARRSATRADVDGIARRTADRAGQPGEQPRRRTGGRRRVPAASPSLRPGATRRRRPPGDARAVWSVRGRRAFRRLSGPRRAAITAREPGLRDPERVCTWAASVTAHFRRRHGWHGVLPRAVQDGFAKYATFGGRSRRSAYWSGCCSRSSFSSSR